MTADSPIGENLRWDEPLNIGTWRDEIDDEYFLKISWYIRLSPIWFRRIFLQILEGKGTRKYSHIFHHEDI